MGAIIGLMYSFFVWWIIQLDLAKCIWTTAIKYFQFRKAVENLIERKLSTISFRGCFFFISKYFRRKVQVSICCFNITHFIVNNSHNILCFYSKCLINNLLLIVLKYVSPSKQFWLSVLDSWNICGGWICVSSNFISSLLFFLNVGLNSRCTGKSFICIYIEPHGDTSCFDSLWISHINSEESFHQVRA